MVLIRIYKIWSELGNSVYIGSTEQTLAGRFSKHKSDYKMGTIKEASKCLFAEYGVENCIITEICAILCETKEIRNELEASYIKHWRERQEYICVNICTPARTNKQYRIDKCDFVKKINDDYRLKNKEKIIKYREDNREKRNEKFNCQICNGKYTQANKTRHFKSKGHQNALTLA